MKMDAPAVYRIKVQGSLEADWAERIGGLAVKSVDVNGDKAFEIIHPRHG
jgi:hypothetical protein